MATFQFRLERALNWYERRYRIEESRLASSIEQLALEKRNLEAHRQEVLASRSELIRTPGIYAYELASLASFRVWASQKDLELSKKSAETEGSVERQRAVTREAQRRLRLLEKLRERYLADDLYKANRELEELASESHLASFARALHTPPSGGFPRASKSTMTSVNLGGVHKR